jgi:predicted lipoprotein with Yx(FWY)xxD motif
MTRTRVPLAVIAVVVAALVVIVATSGSSTRKATANTASAASAISLRQTSLGQTLVDANGRTLYLFAPDKTNASTLSAAGQAVWRPFTAPATPQASGGAVSRQIGTVARGSGNAQVTYNGHPLYYYVGDHNPGQTLGQALNQFGGLWYVMDGSGKAVTSPPSSSAPAGSGGGGSSYGY